MFEIFKMGEHFYYRWQVLAVNASGALEPTGEWSEWKIVLDVDRLPDYGTS